MIALLLTQAALAQDVPHVWGRGLTAVAVNPSGLLVDVASEVRAPILRYGGAVFNGTFIGAGARVAVSPAHLDTGVRLSIQPIDVLPITFEAVRTEYWESPFGLVPFDGIGDTTTAGRRPLYDADLDFGGSALGLSASPTLQMKVGPVVGFTNWTFTALRVRPRGVPQRAVDAADLPSEWVFEPFRGMVVAYDDLVFEHTSAILLEPSDGEDRPLVRIGPVVRGRWSRATPDRMLQLGGIGQWRPGHGVHDPTLALVVAEYLQDPDYLGPVPFLAMFVTVDDAWLLKN